jgi:hypothetical protein
VSVRGRLSERERETEMRARVVNRPPPDPYRAGESPKQLDPNCAGELPTVNSCFMPLVNRPPNLFIKKRERERERERKEREREREREREKKRSLLDFGRISARSRRNPEGYCRNYCLRSILGKKKSKVVTCCSIDQWRFD